MMIFSFLKQSCLNTWKFSPMQCGYNRNWIQNWKVKSVSCLSSSSRAVPKGQPLIKLSLSKAFFIKKAECQKIDAFELWCWRRLENSLDCKEIQPIHLKGKQSWIFIGRTDAEAETPILWPPDAKSWLIGKDPDAGKDWRQEEKGTTEDEMGWMASLTQWTWVWVNSGSQWWTGRPGMLQPMGSQRVGHDWVTELNWKRSLPFSLLLLLLLPFQVPTFLSWCPPLTWTAGGAPMASCYPPHQSTGPAVCNIQAHHPWTPALESSSYSATIYQYLWPPDSKSWLLGKDPDAGKDWGKEEKGTTKDKMVGWHHRLKGHEFEQGPGDGDGPGSLELGFLLPVQRV